MAEVARIDWTQSRSRTAVRPPWPRRNHCLWHRAGLLVDGLLGQKVPQVVGHVLGRRVALRGPLRQGLQADAFQFLRDVVVVLPGRAGLEARDLLQQFRLRVGTERLASDQQFVEDHAQAEDVAAAIDPMPFATSLFGTHVGRRPGVAWPLAHVLLPQGQPEIRHERLAALVEQDVARLDVPMHQPLLVGVVQRLGHRRHQFDGFVQRQAGTA